MVQMPTFRSEDGVDRWIFDNLELPSKGVYVDCGAAWPDIASNTAFLREMGWTGLAIDGNPEYAQFWKPIAGAQFVHVVLGLGGRTAFLIEPTNAHVSRIHPMGEPVESRRLHNVIQGAGITQIDLLAMDLEGVERDVLLATDWNVIPKPSIIIVEYHSAHGGRDFGALDVLMPLGYALVHMTSINMVFQKR